MSMRVDGERVESVASFNALSHQQANGVYKVRGKLQGPKQTIPAAGAIGALTDTFRPRR
jgi:hypothetical protein